MAIEKIDLLSNKREAKKATGGDYVFVVEAVDAKGATIKNVDNDTVAIQGNAADYIVKATGAGVIVTKNLDGLTGDGLKAAKQFKLTITLQKENAKKGVDAGVVKLAFADGSVDLTRDGKNIVVDGTDIVISKKAKDAAALEIVNAGETFDNQVPADDNGGQPGQSFTLTASADSVNEDGSVTYTVTASKAVTEATDVVFTLVPGSTTAADQGTATTNLNDFGQGAFNPVTVTIPVNGTTATFTITPPNDDKTELAESFSVQAVVAGTTLTKTATLLDGASGGGKTYTLTTGTDNLVGTNGNDTFTGDVTANQVQAADTVDGGAGTDTLKIFGVLGAGAGGSATTEQAGIQFMALADGKSVTVGGLTITNTAGDGTTTISAANVAKAFSGATVANATKSGALVGWTAGADQGTDTLVFTSVTQGANVADIVTSTTGTAIVVTTTQGSAATAASSQSVLPTIKNVEVLQLGGALGNASLDFTNYTKAATGIEQIVLDNVAALNGKTVTTTAGQSLSLATGASNVATAGKVTWAASNTDTSASLVLNGYQGGTGVTAQAVDVTGTLTTTLNIASKGAANAISTLTGPTTVTKQVITGDQNLTYALAAADAAKVKTIDASAATGAVKVDTSAGAKDIAFAFTGGTGNDKLTLRAGDLAKLTAGSQLDGGAGTDTLAINDTTLAAADYAKINATKNFEVLGLEAGATVDASKLTSIKSFAVNNTGTDVISALQSGSTVDILAATTKTTLGGDTGVKAVTINLGAATSTGIANSALDITGLTEVALTSNGKAGSANSVGTLTNSENTTFTITGSTDLTIALTVGATVSGSSILASGFTGKLTATGTNQADIIVGGSGADTIKGGAGNDVLTGNGGADKFVTTNVTAAGTDWIKDFVAGTDKIYASNNTTGTTNATTIVDKGALSTTTYATLDAAVASFATGGANVTTAGYTYVFTYGTDTYALIDIANAGYVAGDDAIVKLTGITGTLAATDIIIA